MAVKRSIIFTFGLKSETTAVNLGIIMFGLRTYSPHDPYLVDESASGCMYFYTYKKT